MESKDLRVSELSVYGWWPKSWTVIDRFLDRDSLTLCTDRSIDAEDFRDGVRRRLKSEWDSSRVLYHFFTQDRRQARMEVLAFGEPDGIIIGVDLDDATPADVLRECEWLIEMGTSLLLVEPGRPPPLSFEQFIANAARGWLWIFEA